MVTEIIGAWEGRLFTEPPSDLTWDERFEGLSRDQLCEVKDALNRAFEKVEEEAGR